MILAGGLTPDNVGDAIEHLAVGRRRGHRGRGAAGRKDAGKLRAFVQRPGGRAAARTRRAGRDRSVDWARRFDWPRPRPVTTPDGTFMLMGDPGPRGRFGDVGGRFVPETLVPACQELEAAFREAWADPAFRAELDRLLRDYAGRPSLLTECANLSAELGLRCCSSARTSTTPARTRSTTCWARPLLPSGWARPAWWPRPAPASTGWPRHRRRPARPRVHVYMGEVDMERQALNVFRMRLLGAEVRPATSGSRTLKDAVNEALRDWVATVEYDALPAGLGHGPAPLPVHGARAAPGHRRRGPGAVPGPARGRPRRGRGVRGRRVQRHRHLLRLRRPARRRAGGRRARRRGGGRPRRARAWSTAPSRS